MDQLRLKFIELWRKVMGAFGKGEMGIPRENWAIKDTNQYLVARAEAVGQGKLEIEALLTDLAEIPEYPHLDTVNKLVTVLSTDKSYKRMVQLLVERENLGDAQSHRPAHVVSYIFSSIPEFKARLLEDEELLTVLFEFFSTKEPQDAAHVKILTDILSAMLKDNFDSIFEFLRERPGLFIDMIPHLGHFGVTDLLLEIVTCGKNIDAHNLGEERVATMFDLLDRSDFVEVLDQATLVAISKYSTSYESENECLQCFSVLLGLYTFIIRMPKEFRALESSKKLNPLVRPEKMVKLLQVGLDIREQTDRPLYFALGLWVEVLAQSYLEKIERGSTAKELDLRTGCMEKKVLVVVPMLIDILKNTLEESKQAKAKNESKSKFGSLRLKIVELFVAMISCFTKDARVGLYNLELPRILFDLLEAYENNSILHNLIATGVEVDITPLRKAGSDAWLVDFNVLGAILTFFEGAGPDIFFDATSPAFVSTYKRIALYVKAFLEIPETDSSAYLPERLQAAYQEFVAKVLRKELELRTVPDDERVTRRMGAFGNMNVCRNSLSGVDAPKVTAAAETKERGLNSLPWTGMFSQDDASAAEDKSDSHLEIEQMEPSEYQDIGENDHAEAELPVREDEDRKNVSVI